jgi:glutathione S-transferase
MSRYKLVDADPGALDAQLAAIIEELQAAGHAASGAAAAVTRLDQILSATPFLHAEHYTTPDIFVQSYPATVDNRRFRLCVLYQVFEAEKTVFKLQYRMAP